MLSSAMARDASAQPLLRSLADDGDSKSTLKKAETFSIGDRSNSFSTSKRRSSGTGFRAWCRRFAGKAITANIITRAKHLNSDAALPVTESIQADCKALCCAAMMRNPCRQEER
jgi:hypothetical protein